MAALGPMIARLPPVGQRLPRGPQASPPVFPGFDVHWLGSGTQALALALRAALACRAPARRVILPAYGCPDLVAAAVFAGAEPVLVDCGREDPGYDLEQLDAACTGATAAVVAVNFLGIRERIASIRALCERSGALLVEDCAQSYPEGELPSDVDARILSFGRGKPVNLLGGGALLLPTGGVLVSFAPPQLQCMPALRAGAALAFNLLMHPLPYGILSRLPFLHLGETHYLPLHAVQCMDPARLALLHAAANAWLTAPRSSEAALSGVLHGVPGLIALPLQLSERAGRLLRYPLLAVDAASRDLLCDRLVALGASPFYGCALVDIPGVADLCTFGCVTAARDFAARLLTLPVHAGVGAAHLQRFARGLGESV